MNRNFKLKGNTFTKLFTVMVLIDLLVPNVVSTVIIGVMLLYELLTYLAVKSAENMKFSSVCGKKEAAKGERVMVRLKAEGKAQAVMFASCHAEMNVENMLTGENSENKADFVLTRRGGTGYKIHVTETRCGVVHVTLNNARIQDAFGRKKEYVLSGSQAEILYRPEIQPVELPERFFASGSAGVYLFARGAEFHGAFLGAGASESSSGNRQNADYTEVSGNGTGQGSGTSRTSGSAEGFTLDGSRNWVVKAFEPVAFTSLANQPVSGKIGILFLNYVQKGHVMTPERKSRLAEFALSTADTLAKAGLQHEFFWLGKAADGSAACVRRSHNNSDDVQKTAMELMRTGYTEENGAEILKQAIRPGEIQSFLLISAGGDQEGALFGELGSVRMLKV
ncbi:MAG: hypothetical protein LKG42_00255 [Eubacterium sp.]|jgi:hypothetical protein|nr:hypothetical protein [Eubacterium sp.]MCH4046732.1 hypothetical protein [Eubacterium sp.]MCH4079829.1 hypothetical protein [Eubacterium sp.]MCH4110130.1 hypothetical protein [Eubacterium sp.]MCI1306448.1 hypothetical protein [Eubacterium sp.]